MSSKNIYFVSKLLAEILGTALLLFFGCMGCLTWNREYNHMQSNFTFGLVIMMIIQVFGCVSGAHLNPSVTVASVVYKLLSVKMAICYIAAQYIGAYMGFGLLKYLTPANIFRPENTTGPGVCSTVPYADLQPIHVFAIEYMATTFLVLICCSVWDPRNTVLQDSTPLKFGFAVATLGCVAGPYTGASMNPARSFGPAFWNDDYDMFWIYCVAPLSAGLITALIYRYVFYSDETSDTEVIIQGVKKCSLKNCHEV